jgi:16S rRNA (adenine1518-N6/adenine1519-N6)-dimethyltransferase
LDELAAEPGPDLSRRDVVETLLRRHRVRPEKRLGQNFLIDRLALDGVVSAADLGADDTVLEIGAGLGTLTQQLALRVRRVIAVEYDRRLEPILRETVGRDPRVEIVIGDILRIDLAPLIGAVAYHVVANIPYQITSHLIRRMLEADVPPRRMVVTVQREVAERILAAPGDMNLLALGVQAYGEARIMARLTAASFYPSPRVDSAVLRIDLRQPARLGPQEARAVFRLARAGFSQPRKKLRNAMAAGLRLSPGDVEVGLRRAGVSPDARAEDLSLDEWERLAAGWEPPEGVR